MLNQKLLSVISGFLSFLMGVGMTYLVTGGRSKLVVHVTSTAHTARITAVAASPGGKYLASGDLDGHLKVWGVKGESAVWQRDLDSQILSVTFSRSGYTVAVLTRSGSVSCFATQTGDMRSTTQALPGEAIEGGVLGYIPGGHEPILMAYGGDGLRKWAEQNGNESKLHPFETGASCLAWAPDTHRYVVGNHNGEVKLCDKNTYEELKNWATDLDMIYNVALSKDGSCLAICGEQGLQIRNGETGEILAFATPQQVGQVTALAFSADATKLITGDSDGKLSIWDYNPGSAPNSALGLTRQWAGTNHVCTPACHPELH